MTYKNLVLIGSSHIARESVIEIDEAYLKYKPGVIAIELDSDRLKSMFSKKKEKIGLSAIKSVGVKGYLFAKLGSYVSQKLGKSVGMEPGADMKRAAVLARENNIELALIDQHIQITLSRFDMEFSWREKFRFLGDMFKMAIFRKSEMKKWGIDEFDLNKVPDSLLIEKMMKNMKKRYPSIHKVLIDERNEIMAINLIKLMKKNEEKIVLAVVGAGHVEGMIKIIKKKYNLVEYNKPNEVNNAYSYSVSYNNN